MLLDEEIFTLVLTQFLFLHEKFVCYINVHSNKILCWCLRTSRQIIEIVISRKLIKIISK